MNKICFIIAVIYLHVVTIAIGNLQLDSTQKATLESIAYQTGLEGGDGVYWARAMLELLLDDDYTWLVYGNKIADVHSTVPPVYKVYPNPVKDKLIVECSNCTDSYLATLYDITGKQITSVKLNGFTNVIDTKNYAGGLYQLKIRSDLSSENFKVFILK